MCSSKLAATQRRDFPHHETIYSYETSIPVYAIQLVMEVLAHHELNPFQLYILQFLGLGIDTMERLAYFLGVEKEALTTSLTGLLKIRYIEQGEVLPGQQGRSLLLTDLGRQALQKQGPPPYRHVRLDGFY